MTTNKYVQRLFDEWKLHGRVVVGCDFDDTISPWKLANLDDCTKIMQIIRDAQNVGIYLTIFTACNEDRYEDILNYCRINNLRVDSINANPIDLPYGNNKKIYANIFIDDRAGLDQALDTLKEAMYLMRAYNAGKALDNPGSTEF